MLTPSEFHAAYRQKGARALAYRSTEPITRVSINKGADSIDVQQVAPGIFAIVDSSLETSEDPLLLFNCSKSSLAVENEDNASDFYSAFNLSECVLINQCRFNSPDYIEAESLDDLVKAAAEVCFVASSPDHL